MAKWTHGPRRLFVVVCLFLATSSRAQEQVVHLVGSSLGSDVWLYSETSRTACPVGQSLLFFQNGRVDPPTSTRAPSWCEAAQLTATFFNAMWATQPDFAYQAPMLIDSCDPNVGYFQSSLDRTGARNSSGPFGQISLFCAANPAPPPPKQVLQISLTSDKSEIRPAGTGGGTTSAILTAKVTANGQSKAGVAVQLSAEVTANSGGHEHHDASRPKGNGTYFVSHA